jgi:hypothetical protein
MRVRIAIAGAVIGTTAGITISRAVRWWRSWGHDPLEAAKALPGDELVPTPTAIDTRGITIDAPPEAVWPWLVQMGFDRGGWYSYDRLDMRGTSAEHLIPGMPELKVGDLVPTAPESGFEVRVLEPGKALTLYLDTAIVAAQAEAQAAKASRPDIPAGLAASSAILRTTPPDFAAAWTFVLEPLDGGRTRLIERVRVRFGVGGPAFRIVAPAMGFGVFVMMQRQMLGLRERAMRTAVAPPIVAPPVVAPPRPKSNGRAPEATALTEVVVAAT